MTGIDDRMAARARERVCGVLLAATAVLTIMAIMHHPTLHGRHDMRQTAAAVLALAAMDRTVHGGLMVLFALQALGFSIFCRMLGFHRQGVAAGFAAFAAGAVVMILPAVLDGFVTPDLAQACRAAAGGCTAADVSAFRLVGAMIQDFTKVALILIAVAMACWSSVLLAAGGWARRGAGVIGLACAALPAMVLVSSDVVLRPGSLLAITAGQLVWTFVVAALMFGGDRSAPIGGGLRSTTPGPGAAIARP